MFYEQDWLMKQIQMLVRFVAKVVFGKDTAEYKFLIEESLTGTDVLYRDIMELVAKGEICQAENLLFDNIDTGNKEHLALALDFYNRLNSLDDEVLERCFFSRTEIKDGVRNIMEQFGLNFSDEFLKY